MTGRSAVPTTTHHVAASRRRLQLTIAVLAAIALALAVLSMPVPAGAALPDPSGPVPGHEATVTKIPTFSWDAVPDAARYKIQVATESGFASSSLRYEAEVTSPYAAPKADFAPGTYFWHVMPIGGDGTGLYGPTWSFTRTGRAGPTLQGPEDDDALDFSQDAPVLRWEPLAEVTGYQVETSTGETFPQGSTKSYVTTSASFALTALEPQDRFLHWRVRASYPTANTKSTTTSSYTEWSPARRFTMAWDPERTENSTPELLSPANDSSIEAAVSQPRFSWTPVLGAARYLIQISAAPEFTDIRVEREVGRTSYVGPGTLENQAYYWRVAALDEKASRGPWSQTWQFYRAWLDFDGLPARPTLSAADADPDTTAHEMPREEFLVHWTALPGASHYEVEISGLESFSGPPNTEITCKTPHTALAPVRFGTYKRTKQIKPEGCSFNRNPSGFNIQNYDTVYVRVRGVDVTTGANSYPGGPPVLETYSIWSNVSRWLGDPVPPPFTIDFSSQGPGGPEEPATLTAPIDASDHTDAAVLSWQPVKDANFYLVALSTDQGFRSYETGDTGGYNYVVVPGTRLVFLESLKDNMAGESFYWYVLPCRSWSSKSNFDCRVGDEQAINQAGRFRSFRKVAPAPNQPVDGDGNLRPMVDISGDDVRFEWRDLLATEQAMATADIDPTHFHETGGIKYYELEVWTDSDFPPNELSKRVLLEKTDATEFVPAKHVPTVKWNEGETYYFRVRGYDGTGSPLAWSSDRCVDTPGATPCSFVYNSQSGSPSGLTKAGDGPTPTLAWSPMTAAASYEVQLFTGTDPGFPLGNKVADATAAYPAWTPGNLPAGEYSWRVRKVDTYGAKGKWSDGAAVDWTFTVTADPVGGTSPASGATVRASALRFTWNSLPGAAKYEIQVSSSSDFASLDETAVTTNRSWSPIKKGGYPAGRYYWRVRALSSAASANVLSTTAPQVLDVITPPLEVEGISASSSAKGTVALKWTPRPALDGGRPVSGYRIWFRVKGTSTWGPDRWIPGNVGATTVTGLANNTTYEFKVAAVSDVGTGPDSSTATASTPAVPTAPRVTLTARDRALRVSWSGASSKLPITAYQVWYKPVAATVWTRRLAAKSPLDLAGLSPATAYHVQVAAMNGVGLGRFGTVTPVKPLSAPSAPRGVALKHGSGQVTVTWAPPLSAGSSAVTSYLVSYRKATSTTWSTRSATTRSTTLSLTAGQTYVLHVAARNSVGTGPVSQDVRFLVRAIPGRPSTVTGKVKGTRKLRTLTVAWQPPTVGAPISSYEVQVSLNGRTWSTIGRPRTTSCVWRKARKGKTYSIRVRANNPLGWGPYSSTVRVKA